jgi:hypothetical protein
MFKPHHVDIPHASRHDRDSATPRPVTTMTKVMVHAGKWSRAATARRNLRAGTPQFG